MTDNPRFAGRAIPNPGFAADEGRPDAALDAALAAYTAGTGTARTVLAALAGARLLVPVVAVLESVVTVGDDGSGSPHEKESAMATVTVVGRDGRRAMPAFSSSDALTRWRADARPVAVHAHQAAQAALAAGADSLLVDAAGPTPFAVAGPELRALAFGGASSVPVGDDPQVAAALRACLAHEPLVVHVALQPRDDTTQVALTVPPGLSRSQLDALLRRVSETMGADLVLRSRLAEGIRLVVRQSD